MADNLVTEAHEHLGVNASEDPLGHAVYFLDQFIASDATSMGTYIIACALVAIAERLGPPR